MNFKEEYSTCLDFINEALECCFVENTEQFELQEAMRYSLLSGGKRIRPVLLLKFCEACGGDGNAALPAACGIEMLHTYSLIHDDLPCMDNDDLRRGRPTLHKVYGETNAVLAGDALQAAAFRAVLSCPLEGDKIAKAAYTLAYASGEQGMCGGQYLDIIQEAGNPTAEELAHVHALKTGALLKAACLMGVQLAGGSKEMEQSACEYANHLGIAFQIQDDILDVVGSAKLLGKKIGSDAQNGKTTYATLFGLDECRQLVRDHTELAKNAISSFEQKEFLLALAESLATRVK